jgi:hypothetical protein
MESSIISYSKVLVIQDATANREVHVDRLLGLSRALFSKPIWNVEQLVERGTYCDMFQRELKHAISSKRRGKLSKEILLLHGNARPTLQPTYWKPSNN